MKKILLTAAALAVAGTSAFAEPNNGTAPAPSDNNPAAQSQAKTQTPATKIAKKHHKHHKHHKEKKAEKQTEKPADNQNNNDQNK